MISCPCGFFGDFEDFELDRDGWHTCPKCWAGFRGKPAKVLENGQIQSMGYESRGVLELEPESVAD